MLCSDDETAIGSCEDLSLIALSETPFVWDAGLASFFAFRFPGIQSSSKYPRAAREKVLGGGQFGGGISQV